MTPKSMVGIFNDYAANRRQVAQARKQYVVVSLKKDGTPRQVMASDLDHTAFVHEDDAQVCQARMTMLNPGKVFVIVSLP